jgi:hypothetical protein
VEQFAVSENDQKPLDIAFLHGALVRAAPEAGRVLPELGLNTQSSDSSPLPVTALLIAPGTR